MNTAEKVDQDYWLNPGFVLFKILVYFTLIYLEPYKLGVALFVIKPDLIANGKKDEIFDHVNNQNRILNSQNSIVYSYVIENLSFIRMLINY